MGAGGDAVPIKSAFFRAHEIFMRIPQVPDFTIGMLIESARAGRWLYD